MFVTFIFNIAVKAEAISNVKIKCFFSLSYYGRGLANSLSTSPGTLNGDLAKLPNNK